jgi:rhamnulokinase
MARTKNFVAFDFGASNGRAVLGIFDGRKLRLREIHRFPNQPVMVQGTLYWDVLRLFEELKKGLALAIKNSPGPVAATGIDTWGVDFALLGKDGKLLSNPVAYRDRRTEGIMAKAFRRVSRREIFERTGIQFIEFNTIFQLFAMVKEKSPLLDAADTLLMMPDLFNYFLTGKKVCEFTDATTTQAFDPRIMNWSRPLLKKMGIPTRILAEVVPPGTVLGKLVPELAEDTGAKKLAVIAPACHDTGSAVASVPAQQGRWAYLSSGTWSLMGAEIKKPLINNKVLALNFTNEGGVEGTFRFLKNIAGLWLIQECRRIWEKQDGKTLSYDRMTAMAKTAKAFPFLLDPDDRAFLRPDDMPDAIRKYCRATGQPVPRSRAEIIRGIMESLALKYRSVIEMLNQVLGYKIEILHIVGGGSRNHILCQWTAEALGIPVVAGPVEATAIGNILMQMMAVKVIGSLEEAREIIRQSFPLKTYHPQNNSRWDHAYAEFRKISF